MDPITKFVVMKMVDVIRKNYPIFAYGFLGGLLERLLMFLVGKGLVEAKVIYLKFENSQDKKTYEELSNLYWEAVDQNNEKEVARYEKALINTARNNIRFN